MPTTTTDPIASRRADELFAEHQRELHTRVDRLLAGLLMFEWLAALILALSVSGQTWAGADSSVHPHVWAAVMWGGAIVSLPVWLAITRPAAVITRHVTAAAQMLMSALLIHLGNGRIEMHFHVFGSLAFLAFYRDWRVLVTGTVVVAVDHLARGWFAPLSVYGTVNVTHWRTVEHSAWVIFEDIFLIGSCVQTQREMRRIALNRALLERSYQEVEQKVQERTQQLKDAQDNLVRTARTAGMAEIATSVLHNVGNVLNSVNVSATVVTDRLRQSEVPTLRQVSDLILENKADLGTFMTRDERGQALPEFIRDLSSCLVQEQEQLIAEVTQLSNGIDHIKQIIVSQQTMAKRSNVRALVDVAKVIDSAITMQSTGRGSGTTIDRTLADDLPAAVVMDEHKVLQILINLISNARHAVTCRPVGTRRIDVRVDVRIDADAADGPTSIICLTVTDNGVGIAPEHLTRIFAHGFTTKRDGHGFGLHSAANAAREMGGSLTVASDGLDRGATFTLALPLCTELPATAGQPDAAAA